jgi:hypothetical protein
MDRGLAWRYPSSLTDLFHLTERVSGASIEIGAPETRILS